MMLGTILLILNAISLIFADKLLLAWSWVIIAYVGEWVLYFVVWFIIMLIVWGMTK